MALSRVVSEIFNVEKYCDLEVPVKGQSKSMNVLPFDYTGHGFLIVFYSNFIPKTHRFWGEVLASESWREALRPSPRRWIQEPLVVGDGDGRPQEDPLAVHCFCVCSGSTLLGDLLGVSKSKEHDLLSVLSIYLRIFFSMYLLRIVS